jgi:hypothetical protein|nr:MAG TPA_asm: minor capsid protein 2 [Caudoviricetes sp.]
MQISAKTWNEYITRLSRLNQKAGQLMRDYIDAHGTADTDDLVAYAYGLVTKYGEGSTELACQMYEALAEAQGVYVPAAEPAATASYSEVARMVSATKDQNPANLPNGVSRLVKRAGADTTLKNAVRDGAEWAWIPHGDTCPFCITLASNGWQKASQKLLKGGHAEHIHAHCDCEFAVRFRSDTTVAGYDPDKYYRQYREAGGDINKMRRIDYAARRDAINAQKRAAYAARKGSTTGNDDDKIKAVKDSMTKQVLALPESSQSVLRDYTGFTATRVNFAIRNGNITPQVRETIAALDNALAAGTMPQSVTLYRNTALSFLDLGLPQKPTEQELQLVVDNYGSFPIFSSTSFEDLQLPGRDTVLQMHIPEGYKGCQFIQPVALPKFKYQDEVLFSRGMQYRVLNDSIKDDRYFLEIEVLPNV